MCHPWRLGSHRRTVRQGECCGPTRYRIRQLCAATRRIVQPNPDPGGHSSRKYLTWCSHLGTKPMRARQSPENERACTAKHTLFTLDWRVLTEPVTPELS